LAIVGALLALVPGPVSLRVYPSQKTRGLFLARRHPDETGLMRKSLIYQRPYALVKNYHKNFSVSIINVAKKHAKFRVNVEKLSTLA